MELILKLWLYLGFAACGAAVFHLWEHRRELPPQRALFGLILAIVPLHMFEERIFPGGFHYAYYHAMAPGVVQTQTTALVCNVLVICVLVAIYARLAERPQFVVLAAGISLFEFAHHTKEAVWTMQEFGLPVPYAPGFLTSLVLFLPLAIVCIVWLVRNYAQLGKKGLAVGLVITFLFAVLCVGAPVIATNDVPPHFPDNGFYEQFGVEDIGTPDMG